VGFENVVSATVAPTGVRLGQALIAIDARAPEGAEVWLGIRAAAIVADLDGPYRGEVLDRSPFGGIVSLEGGPPLRVRSARPLGGRYRIEDVSVIPSADRRVSSG
jgi:hypothetical protein